MVTATSLFYQLERWRKISLTAYSRGRFGIGPHLGPRSGVGGTNLSFGCKPTLESKILRLAANYSDMQYFQAFFFVALVVVAIFLTVVWRRRRSNSLLQKWAAQYKYRITRQEYHFVKGPFFWTSAKGQMIYYVVVEDANGNKRSGWVRCGSWWFGLLSDKVEVRWDD